MKAFKWGLVLIVLGLALGVFTFVRGDGDSSLVLTDDDYTFIELEYSANRFSSFDFDLENKRVNIYPSDDDMVHIEYYDSTLSWTTINEGDDELSLIYDHEWYSGFAFSMFIRHRMYHTMDIYLPDHAYQEIVIHSTNGSFDIEDRLFAAKLELSTSNGTFDLENVDVQNDVSLSTSNGDISLDDVNITGDLEIGSSNGEIYLNQVTSVLVDAATSNGRITVNQVDCDTLDVSTSNGRIEATEVTANDVVMISSNGDVHLDVIGLKTDYDYELETTIGQIRIDGERSGSIDIDYDNDKSIVLRTTNGDISLDFVS